jgi:hypothetical protein
MTTYLLARRRTDLDTDQAIRAEESLTDNVLTCLTELPSPQWESDRQWRLTPGAEARCEFSATSLVRGAPPVHMHVWVRAVKDWRTDLNTARLRSYEGPLSTEMVELRNAAILAAVDGGHDVREVAFHAGVMPELVVALHARATGATT